jgi:hypothetical protein
LPPERPLHGHGVRFGEVHPLILPWATCPGLGVSGW